MLNVFIENEIKCNYGKWNKMYRYGFNIFFYSPIKKLVIKGTFFFFFL